MKIIKRNGAEVPFDITKIITAVTKASDSVGGQARLSREQITQIAAAASRVEKSAMRRPDRQSTPDAPGGACAPGPRSFGQKQTGGDRIR